MEGFFLLLTWVVTLYYGEEDWTGFLASALLSLGLGTVLRMAGRKNATNGHLGRADSFLIVALAWVIFSLVGMIPFILHAGMGITDAFFETMSGFTTTGATVVSDIDGLTHGLRFWRCLTQWVGGLGIVVFSFALIPVYEMKNSNIYSAEVTGLELDKLRPKIGATARRILTIYFVLSVACMLCYWMGPMSLYDAVCHALSTLSTGGFGTHSASIAYFHSAYVEYVCAAFMLISSVNFSLYYYFTIRRPKVLFTNEEMRVFFGIVAGAVAVFCLLFWLSPASPGAGDSLPQGVEETFRSALFHVSTIVSSTGFAAGKFDFVAWGPMYWMPTLLLMAIGACAGSTGGGIKVLRILICAKSIIGEFVMQLHPKAILGIRVSGQIVASNHVRRALAYVVLFVVLVAAGTMLLSFMGCDVDTGLGSCISMLSNIGPGTGTTGPSSNFAHLPAASKWLLSFYMLIGRLEFFTVLFLFMPRFWKERK